MLSQTNPNRGANHEFPPVLQLAVRRMEVDPHTSNGESTNPNIEDTSSYNGKAHRVKLRIYR